MKNLLQGLLARAELPTDIGRIERERQERFNAGVQALKALREDEMNRKDIAELASATNLPDPDDEEEALQAFENRSVAS